MPFNMISFIAINDWLSLQERKSDWLGKDLKSHILCLKNWFEKVMFKKKRRFRLMFTLILPKLRIWKSVMKIMAKDYQNKGNLKFILTHVKLSISESFRSITYLFDLQGIHKEEHLDVKSLWW